MEPLQVRGPLQNLESLSWQSPPETHNRQTYNLISKTTSVYTDASKSDALIYLGLPTTSVGCG